MYIPETRSAIVLLLAMGLVANPAFSADGSESQVAATPDASTSAEAGANWGNYSGASATVFGNDVSVGAAQQSVTAGYELGGTGIAGGRAPAEGAILTATGHGRPIRFENGIFVYPSVLLGFGHNDNVGGTKDNRVGSNLWVLRPELVTEIKTHGDRYTLSYLGNYGHYENSSSDDFNHHELWMAGDNYFTSRARLGWGVGYIERSDPRGSTNRVSSAEPDRWHAPVVRALGIYGAQGAIGRLELETSFMQKRYENNRAYTEVADVDLTMLSGRFFYRVLPRTSLVFEARNTWANYVSTAAFPGDNSDLRLYAGLTWDATAKTTGMIKLGRAYKSFADANISDSSSLSWEGNLRWSPLTYSTFDLASSRTPSDSTGVGDYVVNSATSLTWNHKWASYVSSRVSAGLVKTDFTGVDRRDNTKNYGIGFYTEVGYRTRVGVDFTRTDRNSTIDTNDFKRNVVMGTVEFVL